MDADSVFFLRSQEWWSGNVRHQEKLLLHSLKMKCWRDHLPDDMRLVFDELGYPTGRVLLTPYGHTEEHWYYGPAGPPIRFVTASSLKPATGRACAARSRRSGATPSPAG